MRIDVQALYDALAKVLEQREHVDIRVTIERNEEYEEDN